MTKERGINSVRLAQTRSVAGSTPKNAYVQINFLILAREKSTMTNFYFFLNRRWHQNESLYQKELKIFHRLKLGNDLNIDFDILKNSDFQKNTVHNKNIIVILIFRFLIKYD